MGHMVGRDLVINTVRLEQISNAVDAYNDLVDIFFDGVIPAAVGVAGVLQTTAATVGSTGQGSRYMGAGEAAKVAETRTIPNTDKAGRPRVIHYTTDKPTTSAAAAMSKYRLDVKPTHVSSFPLSGVQNQVPPMGGVAADATQAATSRPINGAGRPIPLDP